MNKTEFQDQMGDILSSGYDGFASCHEKSLAELFEGMDKEVLLKWVLDFYHQPYGIEEGVSGMELNFVAKYFDKVPTIVLVEK